MAVQHVPQAFSVITVGQMCWNDLQWHQHNADDASESALIEAVAVSLRSVTVCLSNNAGLLSMASSMGVLIVLCWSDIQCEIICTRVIMRCSLATYSPLDF